MTRGAQAFAQWAADQGVTFVALAERLGMAPRGNSLSSLASGKQKPGPKLRAKLERVAKISAASWDEDLGETTESAR